MAKYSIEQRPLYQFFPLLPFNNKTHVIWKIPRLGTSRFLLYSLSDPDSPEDCRYVGISSNRLSRPHDHWVPNRTLWCSGRGSEAKNHYATWLRKLYSHGKVPVITVWKDFPSFQEMKQAEREVIAIYRLIAWCTSTKYHLINGTAGGEGANMKDVTPEQRQIYANTTYVLSIKVPCYDHLGNFHDSVHSATKAMGYLINESGKVSNALRTGQATKDPHGNPWMFFKTREEIPEDIEVRIAQNKENWRHRGKNSDYVHRIKKMVVDQNGIQYFSQKDAERATGCPWSEVGKCAKGTKPSVRSRTTGLIYTFKYVSNAI